MWAPIHMRTFLKTRKRQYGNYGNYIDEMPSIFLPAPLIEEIEPVNKFLSSLEIGHCSIQGWRVHMEDQFVIDSFTDLNDHILVAIMDGHSGTFAAEFVATHLKIKIEETDDFKAYSALSVKDRKTEFNLLGKALVNTYNNIDEDLRALKDSGVMVSDINNSVILLINNNNYYYYFIIIYEKFSIAIEYFIER
jgi:serine/threonine protein phosphatase PrpC